MLTKQNFTRVTSISRAGSQKEIGIPTLGIGVPQKHKISLGFEVSSLLGDTFNPLMVMGNKQLQQMSLTGFTNLPEHLQDASTINKQDKNAIANLIKHPQ